MAPLEDKVTKFTHKDTGRTYSVGASSPKEHCSHGIAMFGSPAPECVECEIVWYQECLSDAARRVQSCSEQIVKLLAKRARKS